MSLSPRFIHTIYCDDIRMEVGNKMSYVGIYVAGMEISLTEGSGPCILPKLCIVASVQTPRDDPVSSLSFKVVHNDEILQTLDMQPEHLTAQQGAIEANYILYGAILTFQSLMVKESGTLSVIAVTDREELMAGTLKITLNT